ncbi:hypothetical protein SmJEL517_g05972 [Synchytrium microbalum]|uniref:Uncharacterized protein n=1 Tax=Synchytrium microbalum TaxID=1806994 RepID=A0A507BRZ0_9FUNG|nr:uncharacterized protein SmJEL517_g05972 [Synchytrium microbalum]TPX30462.1 hypothetical protein SmJEL517_g05972 [Synchytrium microbalum]
MEERLATDDSEVIMVDWQPPPSQETKAPSTGYAVWYSAAQRLIKHDIPTSIKAKDANKLQHHVNDAISCLECILNGTHPFPTEPSIANVLLPPRFEVITRYHIANLLITYTNSLETADAHLQKAILILGQSPIPHSLDLIFCIKSLQITIFERRDVLKAAKKMLKDMSLDAHTSERMDLWYLSQLKSAEIASLMNDVKQSRTLLTGGALEAQKRGDLDMQACNSLII